VSDATELLERVARGDEQAWREVVARYQRLVFATIRGFRLDGDDAQDVFQETFVRLHRHAGRLRNPQGLARWLVQTTYRLCLDHRERRRVRGEGPIPDDLADDTPGMLERLERVQRAQQVREALAALSPRCRVLLEQLYFQPEPLEYKVIGERLGMPIGSIGPTRARCLEVLLRRLGASLAVEDAAGDPG
jgi:RNA polymerase sigma factor (sigma-70 family)